jgi:hypothetical protein
MSADYDRIAQVWVNVNGQRQFAAEFRSLKTAAATTRNNGAILSLATGDAVTVELAETHSMGLFENIDGMATAFYGMLLYPDV